MNKQLKSLERVCDKRHARLVESSLTEAQASFAICRFLRGWIDRQKSDCNIFFANSLLAGYEVELKL